MNKNYPSLPFDILIDVLKQVSKRQGLEITDADIAGKVGTTEFLFETYYKEGKAPSEIVVQVFERYDHILDGLRVDGVSTIDEIHPPDPYTPPVKGNEEKDENDL